MDSLFNDTIDGCDRLIKRIYTIACNQLFKQWNVFMNISSSTSENHKQNASLIKIIGDWS